MHLTRISRDCSELLTFTFLSSVADGFNFDIDRSEQEQRDMAADKVLLDCIRNTESGQLAYNVFTTTRLRQVDLDLAKIMVTYTDNVH